MELLIGCGAKRKKQIALDGGAEEWTELVTLDMNRDHDPDVVWDLNELQYPFDDDKFDEIHAYEVLEHTGQQGDWRFFFDQFAEFWRILKPGGLLFGTSPAMESRWAWGDPGHTRIISAECLTYLNQPEYEKQVGNTAITDYRFHYKADFDFEHMETRGGSFVYVLKAVKPSRVQHGTG